MKVLRPDKFRLTYDFLQRKTSDYMRYRHQLLKDAREKRELSQTELAQRVKQTVPTISRVEAGKGPWPKAIIAIAHELDVSLDEVFMKNGKRKSA